MGAYSKHRTVPLRPLIFLHSVFLLFLMRGSAYPLDRSFLETMSSTFDYCRMVTLHHTLILVVPSINTSHSLELSACHQSSHEVTAATFHHLCMSQIWFLPTFHALQNHSVCSICLVAWAVSNPLSGLVHRLASLIYLILLPAVSPLLF